MGEFVEIERYVKKYNRVKSKRQLLLMLSIDEMNWEFSDLKVLQYIELSNLISQLIMLRLFYYSHYIEKIMDRF